MVSHTEVQKALSARIDGEDPGLDNAILDAHLAGCPECLAFWERSLRLTSSLSLVEADGAMAPPKDLSDVIFAGVEGEFRRVSSRRVVALAVGRIFLVILAVIHAFWAGDYVLSATVTTDNPSVAHPLIGLAAVHVGITAALLFAAWKPGQIPGILLIVGAMFGFTVGFVVLEAVSGSGTAPWMQLFTLLFTCLALVFMWFADKGLANPLRRLSSGPLA
nr:Predicted transmembrane transcriptional regulator (anti-sigma factor) [Streptococcus thermophilus]